MSEEFHASARQFERVAARVDRHARLLRAWPLDGGVSAEVTAIEVELWDGQTRKMVVRQYGEADRRSRPRIATAELRLLQMLQSAQVPVPTPYAADESCEILIGPYVVVAFVEAQGLKGSVIAPDALRQMADVLARIHRVDCAGLDPSLLQDLRAMPARLRERPASPDEALSESSIRDALVHARPVQRNRAVLLHGDFWPGNTLWRDGRLAAVIDWEDAGVGDPLADLANGRMEICMLYGQEPMEEFTDRYRSRMVSFDYEDLPYWDLCAALRPAGRMSRWGLGASTVQRMQEGHRRFVGRALMALGRRS